MSDKHQYVKMHQVGTVMVGEYGYQQQLIKDYLDFIEVELWLTKSDDPHYQLIRVTLRDDNEDYIEDKDRIEKVIFATEKLFRKKISFLDIHVGNHPYSDLIEPYEHLSLSTDTSQGKDVSEYYPKIYQSIKEDVDVNMEMRRYIEALKKNAKAQDRKKPLFQRRSFRVSYILIAICTIVYLISVFLSSRYSKSASYIFLGADYGTFTLGLKQFWRLFTCAFVHGGFLHLASNMYSLYIISSYLENRLGKKNYLLTVFVCILSSSLTQDILSENTITVGISGAIYGLLVILIADLLHRKVATLRSFYPLIFINLLINFMDQTAWVAHLGGLVGGFVMYFYFVQTDKRGPTGLIIVMLLCLFIKYATMKSISPIYTGTDIEVLKIYNDLGFRNYALKLAERLYDVYRTYGG